MNDIIYKVLFKGNEDSKENKLTLSFRTITTDKPIKVPSQFIIKLKNLSEKSHKVMNIQNIEEVIKIGKGGLYSSFNYYLIILFTVEDNENKGGFLIGNVKGLGDVLIGIWPFNENLTELTYEKIVERLNNLINKPHEYKNLSLIS